VFETILSIATTLILYLMLGVPFVVWSGRTAYASAMANIETGRLPEPSRAAKIWLVAVPALFIAYYVVSGYLAGPVELDAMGKPVGQGGRQWMFLALSPAMGMILGCAAGAKAARDWSRGGRR
jgi:hypothetical protein